MIRNSSFALLAALIGMAALSGVGHPSGATTIEQLQSLRGDYILYSLGFAFASLIPICLVPLAFGFAADEPDIESPDNATGTLGFAFVIGFAPLSVAASASQYALLPRLINGRDSLAELLYFHSDTSIALGVDMLAYGLFGLGAIFIAAHIARKNGVLFWIASGFAASGVTSVLAFVLYATNSGGFQAFSAVSLALLVPIALLALVQTRRSVDTVEDEAEPPVGGRTVGDV